ncbi:MAG: hypothetical protein MZV49_05315 [Rhodopseudomonas palustris]|nr:hypothetical protein [Rhodopseudomonas palustris]
MMSGRFDLTDMLAQMKQVQKLGTLGGLMKMLPGIPKDKRRAAEQAEREMRNFEVIINSMTPEEKQSGHPPQLGKIRIAKGSGKSASDINRVLKKYSKQTARDDACAQ